MSRLLIIEGTHEMALRYSHLPYGAALELYDSPLMRTVKQCYLSSYMHPNTDVLIVSPVYGLVTPDFQIYPYSITLDKDMVQSLQRIVRSQIIRYHADVVETLIVARGHYAEVLRDIHTFLPQATAAYLITDITSARATIRKWMGLAGTRMPSMYPSMLPAEIHGRKVTHSINEIHEMAYKELTPRARDVRAWYVEIESPEGVPLEINVMWLTRLLTGLEHQSFNSREARTFLSKLGLVIHRKVKQ